MTPFTPLPFLGAQESPKPPDGSALDEFEIPYGELQLQETVGRGGFGTVFAGRYHFAPVAVKRVMDADPGEGTQWRKMVREVEVMASLRHPNVVQLLGICRQPPGGYNGRERGVSIRAVMQ